MRTAGSDPVAGSRTEPDAAAQPASSERGATPDEVRAAAEERIDEALMARFCAGEEAAFEALYQRYAAGILAFLRRLVRDDALADDLLQTTFLSMVRARGRYVAGAGVRGWLFAIAANAGRDALRRRRVRPEVPVDEADPHLWTTDAEMPDPAVARAIVAALERLPPDQREAVLLHKWQELSFEEIAAALGISVSAAKVRAHRGYERLRVWLAELGHKR